jgi:hypothetical protein
MVTERIKANMCFQCAYYTKKSKPIRDEFDGFMYNCDFDYCTKRNTKVNLFESCRSFKQKEVKNADNTK